MPSARSADRKPAKLKSSLTKLPAILNKKMMSSEDTISPHKSIFKPAPSYTQTQGMNKTFDGIVLDKGKEIFYTPYNEKMQSYSQEKGSRSGRELFNSRVANFKPSYQNKIEEEAIKLFEENR